MSRTHKQLTFVGQSLDAIHRPGLQVGDHPLDVSELLVLNFSNLYRRFMGLNDLMLEIKQDPNSFFGDETTETKVLRQVIKLVEDTISEVKNQAVKWCV